MIKKIEKFLENYNGDYIMSYTMSSVDINLQLESDLYIKNFTEELKEFIDSVPYPDVEYVGLESKSNQQKHVEKKQKDFQKTFKESYRNSKEYEDHIEHVKAQRKLKYKGLKEKYKK